MLPWAFSRVLSRAFSRVLSKIFSGVSDQISQRSLKSKVVLFWTAKNWEGGIKGKPFSKIDILIGAIMGPRIWGVSGSDKNHLGLRSLFGLAWRRAKRGGPGRKAKGV